MWLLLWPEFLHGFLFQILLELVVSHRSHLLNVCQLRWFYTLWQFLLENLLYLFISSIHELILTAQCLDIKTFIQWPHYLCLALKCVITIIIVITITVIVIWVIAVTAQLINHGFIVKRVMIVSSRHVVILDQTLKANVSTVSFRILLLLLIVLVLRLIQILAITTEGINTHHILIVILTTRTRQIRVSKLMFIVK